MTPTPFGTDVPLDSTATQSNPLPELTHITLESLAYRVKKMNQGAVLKDREGKIYSLKTELWTRTEEQQKREQAIVERLKEIIDLPDKELLKKTKLLIALKAELARIKE